MEGFALCLVRKAYGPLQRYQSYVTVSAAQKLYGFIKRYIIGFRVVRTIRENGFQQQILSFLWQIPESAGGPMV